MKSTNSSIAPLKSQAKVLRKYLAEQKISLGHSKCLEAVARMRGYRNWDTASAVLRRIPHSVIMTRNESNGDPFGFDVWDFFHQSFRSEGDSVSGCPDAVAVHVALCDGKEVHQNLASRLLAVCYTVEEHTTVWKRLTDAFNQLNPTRRKAWIKFDERFKGGGAKPKSPVGVVMTPNEWHGYPTAQEAYFFARSFQNEDGSIVGNPEAVEVHVALRDGTRPKGLNMRLLAICDSQEEYNAACEKLSLSHEPLYSCRAKAMRKVSAATIKTG